MKHINYIFYRIYVVCRKADDNSFDAAVYAALIAAILSTFNCLTILVLLWKFNIIPYVELYKFHSIGFGLGLFVIYYFLFVHKNRFQQIENFYKEEKMQTRSEGIMYFVFLVILTFLIFILASRYRVNMYHLTEIILGYY
jgi:hypothetical protein